MNTKPHDRSPVNQARVRDLQRLLAEQLSLHEDLVELLQRQLLAMRRSDVDEIQTCVRLAEDLAEKIEGREGLRRQLMVLIGQDIGVEGQQAKTMSLGALAIHLDDRPRLKLRAVADRLSRVMTQIAKVNAVLTLFARDMLYHYRQVFSAITCGTSGPLVYCVDGAKAPEMRAQVVDARG